MEDKIIIKDLNLYFDTHHVLKSINLNIKANEILSIIGPANSGKTSFLRTLNRLNDITSAVKISGEILLDGMDIYKKGISLPWLRRKVGMVFALPVPLPRSIFENIVYGPRLNGVTSKDRLEELVEKTLKSAFLWDEVKDRLHTSGTKLSGGQQQRLCIARSLALEPEVILLDEPCSGLDPLSTSKIEEALYELKKQYTIVLVTNNTKQAARVGDNVAFFLMGDMIEYGSSEHIFTVPNDKRTEDYITGRFG
ncbi:phosphate ABC transporter ATP-binding protein [Candidatus Desantisbacteria bacterium CG2_30_40_21]|uniref:Phosphate ABC transporter ATP-binding protein n=5 Tax=unclassified Candidatus Desantisiibacteriota TaxID=3106372 RepID=A0A2M7J8L8_9BACT|nr:MAG: phosphate ABC transporter ATP-binding protein [Candidatus Desantisbacteria bacterium CG2_30_40_21]PIP40090.1 MAG: phosphate ABC transporter ATP-binding protein [Candidatus Desantisbacteria bacterium CG23_combo_of_CG06-09_8_20_14_all_40_23]PIX15735.1 MAG: phosphate ABC transporter ATP-binding protein [Candidatus Desantisbacteria bacterium CG_4_8_14_3_um_filter_40_12]PIY19230.1 MAG: phosphate ABC transporter ATP-binding protein [Candidatus Desantisbacteria bacterium CG_4_10_14_3_um_filter_